jgi:hypothetical protein
MNTTDKNKLLAEFMGKKELITESQFLSMEHKAHNPTIIEYLKYETSWDWLMPLIAKIEDLGNDVLITTNYIQIAFDEGEQFIVVDDTKNKIESVYNACVAFVQWYNSSNRA